MDHDTKFDERLEQLWNEVYAMEEGDSRRVHFCVDKFEEAVDANNNPDPIRIRRERGFWIFEELVRSPRPFAKAMILAHRRAGRPDAANYRSDSIVAVAEGVRHHRVEQEIGEEEPPVKEVVWDFEQRMDRIRQDRERLEDYPERMVQRVLTEFEQALTSDGSGGKYPKPLDYLGYDLWMYEELVWNPDLFDSKVMQFRDRHDLPDWTGLYDTSLRRIAKEVKTHRQEQELSPEEKRRRLENRKAYYEQVGKMGDGLQKLPQRYGRLMNENAFAKAKAQTKARLKELL